FFPGGKARKNESPKDSRAEEEQRPGGNAGRQALTRHGGGDYIRKPERRAGARRLLDFCPGRRADALFAEGEIVDPGGETFTGRGLIVRPAEGEVLEDGRDFGPFKLSFAFLEAHLRDFFAVDEEAIALGRVIHILFRESPIVGELAAFLGAGPEFL